MSASPNLINAKEVAKLLGVTHQRVRQALHDEPHPLLVPVKHGGRYWFQRDRVEVFARLYLAGEASLAQGSITRRKKWLRETVAKCGGEERMVRYLVEERKIDPDKVQRTIVRGEAFDREVMTVLYAIRSARFPTKMERAARLKKLVEGRSIDVERVVPALCELGVAANRATVSRWIQGSVVPHERTLRLLEQALNAQAKKGSIDADRSET